MTSAEDIFIQLVQHFEDSAGVTPPDTAGARGFGSTALKVDGSIFAMLSRGALVLKLPRDRVTELIATGIGLPFTAGKTTPMKEWIVVTADDQPTCRALAREALAFNRRH